MILSYEQIYRIVLILAISRIICGLLHLISECVSLVKKKLIMEDVLSQKKGRKQDYNEFIEDNSSNIKKRIIGFRTTEVINNKERES